MQLTIKDERAELDGSQLDSAILDAEILKRMARYKRHPSTAQLRARLAPKFGDANLEVALLRLLRAGQVAVTNGTFWLRGKEAA